MGKMCYNIGNDFLQKGNIAMSDTIVIRGARENNLKNIDLTIPRDKLVVFTGNTFCVMQKHCNGIAKIHYLILIVNK